MEYCQRFENLCPQVKRRANVSGEAIDVADFLGTVFPGKQVEFAARPTMIGCLDTGMPNDMFFQSLYTAYARHYAFTLRPEVLMHLIVGEVATTVNRQPEEYRHLFTRAKEGKTKIVVRHDGLVLGDLRSPWHEAIGLFREPLKENVPPGIMEHILPDFSTATEETRLAGLITFMDAAQAFYEYGMTTLCGVPAIYLAGAAEDYRKVLVSASALAEVFDKHLGLYFQHLLPVLKKISDQAAGESVDTTFWGQIYKHHGGSGTDDFSGWISTFLNYTNQADRQKRQYIVAPKSDKMYDWRSMMNGYGAIPTKDVPSHLSSAPFLWTYFDKEIPMKLVSGVLGVETADNSLMPMLSYAVLHE